MMGTSTRVVVTRERYDAERWVAMLSEHGIEVLRVPWLDLVDVPTHHLSLPALSPERSDALMFVSAKAARVLARSECPWVAALMQQWALGRGPRVWAPGPGTAKQLRAQGVPAAIIDVPPPSAEQYDTEHLWPVVKAQVHPGFQLCIIRGEVRSDVPPAPWADEADTFSGRHLLQQRCEALGAVVGEVVVYQRALPIWTADEKKDWLAGLADPRTVWLASSSMALQWAQALAQAQGQSPGWCASRCVLTTHPRIQATARSLGWGTVALCRPDFGSVLAAITTQANPAA